MSYSPIKANESRPEGTETMRRRRSSPLARHQQAIAESAPAEETAAEPLLTSSAIDKTLRDAVKSVGSTLSEFVATRVSQAREELTRDISQMAKGMAVGVGMIVGGAVCGALFYLLLLATLVTLPLALGKGIAWTCGVAGGLALFHLILAGVLVQLGRRTLSAQEGLRLQQTRTELKRDQKWLEEIQKPLLLEAPQDPPEET